MLKKNLLSLFVLFTAIFIFDAAVRAQETEAAASSNLTDVSLPANGQRVLPASVPAEITQTLEKIVAAGNGKVRQGDTEVLVWAGANYKRANAPAIINRLTGTLKADGWTYEVGGSEEGVTVFSALKDGGQPRAVVGFHGATDDALILAWTEVLSPGNKAGTVVNDSRNEQIESSPVVKSGGNTGGGDIVGIWRNGGMSTMVDKNRISGATTPSNGSTFKYVFTADGRFEFIGMMQSTMYGCTTSLFQDKRGRYEINGSTMTLIPSKNFWRNQNSCAPNSTKERDYTLERETLEFRTKTDEYGKFFICLAGAKGETCYRREKE
ncbi:MAG TPA: hypothetical protein VK308_09160 [Pyrinomonadaceae bacterium]|nr:hypothetical protein [Pyrinomonadaceae bacterium]